MVKADRANRGARCVRPSPPHPCGSADDCVVDDNACRGEMVCDLAGELGEPGTCQHDPATAVVCDPSADTPCLRNTCLPPIGLCEMVAVDHGLPCDDGDPATDDTVCVDGSCVLG